MMRSASAAQAVAPAPGAPGPALAGPGAGSGTGFDAALTAAFEAVPSGDGDTEGGGPVAPRTAAEELPDSPDAGIEPAASRTAAPPVVATVAPLLREAVPFAKSFDDGDTAETDAGPSSAALGADDVPSESDAEPGDVFTRAAAARASGHSGPRAASMGRSDPAAEAPDLAEDATGRTAGRPVSPHGDPPRSDGGRRVESDEGAAPQRPPLHADRTEAPVRQPAILPGAKHAAPLPEGAAPRSPTSLAAESSAGSERASSPEPRDVPGTTVDERARVGARGEVPSGASRAGVRTEGGTSAIGAGTSRAVADVPPGAVSPAAGHDARGTGAAATALGDAAAAPQLPDAVVRPAAAVDQEAGGEGRRDRARDSEVPLPARNPGSAHLSARALQSALTLVQGDGGGAPVPLGGVAAPVTAGSPMTYQQNADNILRLVQSMQVLVRNGTSEATIRLRPEHLGDVSIAIRVEGRSVAATIRAESAGVREWIQSQEDALRTGLAQQGLSLDRLVVQRDPRHDRQAEEPPPESKRHRARKDTDAGERFEVTV